MRRNGIAAVLIALALVAVLLAGALGYTYVVTSSQISSLEQTTSSQSSAISSQQQVQSQQSSQIATMNAEISALNENITAITNQRMTLQTQAASDQTQITADLGNITALVSQRSMLQSELTQANGNNTDLMLKTASLTSQIQSLSATVGALNSTITTLNSQITTLTAETVTLTTQATQLQTQETQLQAIVTLGDSAVELPSQEISMPAGNATYLPQVGVVNFTAQYSGYVSIVYADATNATFTGPLVLDLYSPAVSLSSFSGLYLGPFTGIPPGGTVDVPIAPGMIAIYLVNFAESRVGERDGYLLLVSRYRKNTIPDRRNYPAHTIRDGVHDPRTGRPMRLRRAFAHPYVIAAILVIVVIVLLLLLFA